MLILVVAPITAAILLLKVTYVELTIVLIIFTIIIVSTLFTFFWISKYYNSIIYKLTEDEIIIRQGVWFKKTSIVPYNRITNIDVQQGPISRKLGIVSLKIQTAGYSGQPRSEAVINGIEEFDEFRDTVRNLILRNKPVATEVYEDPVQQILKELHYIREILEKLAKIK